ncbi:MAG: CRISPR-associated endonuclease Cas3'' [Oscillospiraceae bacterium]
MGTAQYFARSANDRGEWETLPHHLERAGILCSKFLSELGYAEWGIVLGRFHDFGKYGELFQQVLRHAQTGVDHASPGAALVYSTYRNSPGAVLAASVIASHHSSLSLCDAQTMRRICQGNGSRQNSDGYRFSLFGPSEMKEAVAHWLEHFPTPALKPGPPEFSSQEDGHLAQMLFLRFLYSALVDADYSSSAEHYEPDYLSKYSGPPLDISGAEASLLQLREQKRAGSTAAKPLNRLRDQLFDDCLAAAKQPPGLFTLTAPTGLGKTLSLFAFALEHCKRHGKRRVIVVVPFLSVIEQNVKDYKQLVPALLEIHSNAKAHVRELSQRWDAPCIVTTNVGFLEPLFSDLPGDCRHLHQLANSVVVFDEAQSLPPHLLDATLRTLKLLCEQYGCTVVFSTATQPAFDKRPGLAWKPREIVKDPEAMFLATRRVRYDWRIDRPTPLEQVAQEVAGEPQACVIVNLRAHARKLYQLVKERCGEEDVFFMTTDLCPAHRLAALEEVRRRLAGGKPCRLIATQCIEAGVDLDFPLLYRALAPLESIIQAAGRCNRNGDTPSGRVVVFIPDEERLYPPGPYYQSAALKVKALSCRHPIDCSSLAHVREYYELLYAYAEGDERELRDAVAREDFAATAAAYRLIRSSGIPVIVPYEGEKELYEEICAELDSGGVTPQLLQKARPITVSSFDRAAVERYCVPLSCRSYEPDVPPQGAGVYRLAIPEFYTAKQGLLWEESHFDGIQ